MSVVRLDRFHSLNAVLSALSVDLLTDCGVRTVEDGILFPSDGPRARDDGMLCRFDGDLRAAVGILFPSHGIRFPHSAVHTDASVDLPTDLRVRSAEYGNLFPSRVLPDQSSHGNEAVKAGLSALAGGIGGKF